MASEKELAETFFDKHCVVCSKSGKHVEATNTCLDCKQTLCSGCRKYHDKFDAMKGHRIVEKAMSVSCRAAVPTQLCDQHDKLIDMFCPKHDHVCCTSCIAIHHRRCGDFQYVPSICAGTKTRPELQTVLQNITDVTSELRNRKQEREDDKKRIADEKYQADMNVNKSAERIIKHVNEMKRRSLHQIQQKYDEFQKRVDDDIEKINAAVASLEKDVKDIQSPAHSNESQLFVTMTQGKEHRQLGLNLNTETGTSRKREALYFNIDKDIEIYINKLEMMGELETPFFSSSEVGQYKIRLKKDKATCYISGMCPWTDGTILLIDRENEKLKRLDTSYNIMDYCKLPGRPYSICRTGPVEVAITLTKQKMVQFVSVAGTLTPTRSFRVGEACRGIAYSQGKLFITCGGNTGEGPGEFRVFNIDGKLLHKLPQHNTSQKFSTCPIKIALASQDTKVIVTDREQGVVTMNTDGSNVNSTPLDAWYVNVQDQSLCFVGGDGNNNNIFQISSNSCSSLGPLLTKNDGIDEIPRGMCYQKDGHKLIVGFRNRDIIKVFKLYRM